MLKNVTISINTECDHCGRTYTHEVSLDGITDIILSRETVNAVGYCTYCQSVLKLVRPSDDEV